MTFKELEIIVKGITCQKLRARAERLGKKYFKITASAWHEDKDHEFDNESSLFILSEERIIETEALARMGEWVVIETVRNMMLTLYLHEFDEFFKLNQKTVRSPHLDPEQQK